MRQKEINIEISFIKFIFSYLNNRKVAFVIFFITPLFTAIQTNLIPYCIREVIEILSQNAHKENILESLSSPLLLSLFGWVLFIVVTRLQNYWQCYIFPSLIAETRQLIFERIINSRMENFSKYFAGSVAQKIVDLPKSIDSILFFVRWKIIATLSTVIVALLILNTINFTFVSLLFLYVVIKLIIASYVSKKVCEYSLLQARDENLITGSIAESIANIFNVKLFSGHATESNHLKKIQKNEIDSNIRLMLSVNKTKALLDLISTIMLFTVLFFLVNYYQLNLITTGDFIFVFTVSFNIMMSMWQLCEALPDFYRNLGVAKQALLMLEQFNSYSPSSKIDVFNNTRMVLGDIRFDSVSFQYKNVKNRLFNNLNLRIKPGEIIGIVGKSGAGKTTLVHLLLKLYEVDKGKITLDGKNIAEIDEEFLRSQISIINQNPLLFSRTIYDNITYGIQNPTSKQVILAAKAAQCHDFIMALPENYQTQVGKGGNTLSAGQKQMIAIARAILKNSPIIILDEATSSLDTISETQLNQRLSELFHGRTIIIIAHRLTTLTRVDRILVFHNGSIVEEGTHEELISKMGYYKSLWDYRGSTINNKFSFISEGITK